MKHRILSSVLSVSAAALILQTGCASVSKKSYALSSDSTIENHQAEFQKCYDQALKQKRINDPSPQGRMVVGFTVSPSGTVTESNVITTELGSPKLEKCVQETLKRIKFPSNDEGRLTQTTYPFDFVPKDDAAKK